jgi:hypothetical protein
MNRLRLGLRLALAATAPFFGLEEDPEQAWSGC